jgi:hypothetical protein
MAIQQRQVSPQAQAASGDEETPKGGMGSKEEGSAKVVNISVDASLKSRQT